MAKIEIAIAAASCFCGGNGRGEGGDEGEHQGAGDEEGVDRDAVGLDDGDEGGGEGDIREEGGRWGREGGENRGEEVRGPADGFHMAPEGVAAAAARVGGKGLDVEIHGGSEVIVMVGRKEAVDDVELGVGDGRVGDEKGDAAAATANEGVGEAEAG